jgi:ubiquinol-cytochrome c reductase cytochrome b subunit
VWKDLIFSAAIIGAVLCCAIVFGPFGPSGMPDPTIIDTVPKPDFFFLWLYALLSLLPPNWETPFLLIAPPIAIAILLVLPLVAGTGEKSWHRRPVAVLTLLILAVGWATLTRLATYAPWSPQMSAWSGAPIPVHFIRNTTPLMRQGANVFQYKQCRNCHALGGLGGVRGPALDDVAARMTHDQLIRQVIQGGGNMPAFGTSLSPAEVTALVQFLETLHPPNQQRAQDVSRGLAESGERPRQGDVEQGSRY